MSSKIGQLGVTFPDTTVQSTRVGTQWTGPTELLKYPRTGA